VDIANGAPTGADATDELVLTWVDGRDGLNDEHVMVSYSTNRGASWSAPAAVENPTSDRGYYSAPALSPDGTDLYLVYNAFTTPFRNDTTSPRGLVGVVLHANIGAGGGAPTGWTVLHRGAVGDPRGSSQNNLQAEFLGDYVYAAATRSYGAAVWNDARNAADCPALDAWRMSLRPSGDPLPSGAKRVPERERGDDDPTQEEESPPPPAPQVACPATFGNTDIYGGSWLDPSPEAGD
ncbi:MAG: exo-alpha-sialidase, partial [Thermoleophilia bacterium]|nr:exo-alpha-sialidase [Thermoleophilia bacterium]